jgi:hypothetical protein
MTSATVKADDGDGTGRARSPRAAAKADDGEAAASAHGPHFVTRVVVVVEQLSSASAVDAPSVLLAIDKLLPQFRLHASESPSTQLA